jgi:hypothetical protein
MRCTLLLETIAPSIYRINACAAVFLDALRLLNSCLSV